MNYASCPTGIVNAPVEFVWGLLTHPETWEDFYDVRVIAVDPAGSAVMGQRIFAESGPGFLHLRLEFQIVEIDSSNYRLAVNAQFPFGVTVREDLVCLPLGSMQCRVSYHCNFGFPAGWRGAVTHFLFRRQLDTGPADSLARLKRHAELLYANSPTRHAERD